MVDDRYVGSPSISGPRLLMRFGCNRVKRRAHGAGPARGPTVDSLRIQISRDLKFNCRTGMAGNSNEFPRRCRPAGRLRCVGRRANREISFANRARCAANLIYEAKKTRSHAEPRRFKRGMRDFAPRPGFQIARLNSSCSPTNRCHWVPQVPVLDRL